VPPRGVTAELGERASGLIGGGWKDTGQITHMIRADARSSSRIDSGADVARHD
jgi:hypothetical protein